MDEVGAELPGRGARVAERYRIDAMLGRGGCGVVYRAHDERLHRDVALKILWPRAAERIASLRPRFEREIALLRRLEHPNIVRLYDAGQWWPPGDTFGRASLRWMALELVRGSELHQVSPTPMPPARVRHVVLQLLSGLGAVHRCGIVHRDVKPNNVMLCAPGADRDVVKLLDFGIGKWLTTPLRDDAGADITRPDDALLGTPRYMAPELLLRQTPGPWSDVYAAGLVMLELLTGEPAVAGDDVCQVIAHQVASPIELPDWLHDSPFGPLLRRATAKSWRDRFPDALAFHEALRQAEATPALEQAWRDAHTTHGAHRRSTTASTAAPLTTEPLPAPGRAPLAVHTDLAALPSTAPPSPARRHRALALGAALLVAMATFWLALRWPVADTPAVAAAKPAHDERTREPDPTPAPTPPPEPLGLAVWHLESQPAGARVELASGELACPATPCRIVLPRSALPLELRFERSGYLDTHRVVDGDSAHALDVALEPAPGR